MVDDLSEDHRELLFLRALREVGVLEALVTSAGTPEELAAETAVSPRMARFTLETLSTLNYVTQVDGTYEPTNALLGLLTTRDVRSIGSLPATIDDADRLVRMSDRLTGRELSEEGRGPMVNSLGAASARSEATVRAVGTAVLRGAPEGADALVLNGSPGRLAVEIGERGVEVTLVDNSNALDRSEGVLAGSQVTPMPTSDWEDLPTSELIVAAPGFRRDPMDRSRLLSSATSAVAPDGQVVIVDRFHEEGEGDPLASVMDVARTGATRDRSIPAIRTAMERNGLAVEAIDPIPGTEFVAVRSTQSRD